MLCKANYLNQGSPALLKIIFIEHSGERHTVHTSLGISVMEAAVDNGVPGISADCGGACACGTCHVYVENDWIHKVGMASDMEGAMLECASDPAENSRLSCQIEVVPELDGLVVRLPSSQP
jgi:2Fe-2S ferredoxin